SIERVHIFDLRGEPLVVQDLDDLPGEEGRFAFVIAPHHDSRRVVAEANRYALGERGRIRAVQGHPDRVLIGEEVVLGTRRSRRLVRVAELLHGGSRLPGESLRLPADLLLRRLATDWDNPAREAVGEGELVQVAQQSR